MDTDDIMEKWRREAFREGWQGGIAHSLIKAYEARFGVIPPELRAMIEETRDEATLDVWHALIITQSAEEVAAALRGSRRVERGSSREEFLVDTDDIVENWLREARLEGMLLALIDLYEIRFGEIPSDIRAVLEATRDEATVDAWRKLIITRSAEEALAAIRGSRAS